MLDLTILTPQKTLVSAQVERVVVPGTLGQACLLPRHADYMTLLSEGAVMYGAGDHRHKVLIKSGLAQIHKDKVVIWVAAAEAGVV